ncbi:MAG: DinB family protein [Bacteroidales bacterium]|nr:DinB family protein [Bacteroidales bacterium]
MMNNDFISVTNGILEIINKWEIPLQNLSDDIITKRLNKQNRTIKQILGHLVDSASNNHQRMVRLQYNSDLAFPDYRQDNDRWIAIQNYQDSNWNNLIQLWKYFNLHIIHVIQNTDKDMLQNCWHDFEGTRVTLEQMIYGYLDHLNLHINEIKDLINK